eukprot:6195422-Pleurochrysis_carterae.AAC.2
MPAVAMPEVSVWADRRATDKTDGAGARRAYVSSEKYRRTSVLALVRDRVHSLAAMRGYCVRRAPGVSELAHGGDLTDPPRRETGVTLRDPSPIALGYHRGVSDMSRGSQPASPDLGYTDIWTDQTLAA